MGRFWLWTTAWVTLATMLAEIVTFCFWQPQWGINYHVYLIRKIEKRKFQNQLGE